MRSPFAVLSLGCFLAGFGSVAHAAPSAQSPASIRNVTARPLFPSALHSPDAVAQWTQEQEERFEAQREAERQRAADRLNEVRQQFQDARQDWRIDDREWRTRRIEQNEQLQDRWDENQTPVYGDRIPRYFYDDDLYDTAPLYDYRYRPYPHSSSYDERYDDDWTFRLRYSDDDLDIEYGSQFPPLYRHDLNPYDDYNHNYDPVIVDRVYVPVVVPSFGYNSLVQVELISETRSDVSVVLIGRDGNQQLAFDAFTPSQSIYLPAGTYQIAFIDAMNNRTWLSGYLDLGFSPVIRIEFNQGTERANLYGDPYAWRAE